MKFFQCLLLVLAIALAVESCKKSKTVRRIIRGASKLKNVADKVVKVGGIVTGRRMLDETMDEDEEMDYKIEKAAFTLCDNEDDNALTWDEVMTCEVSTMNYSLHFDYMHISLFFQEKYNTYLSMELPTQDDFNFYDVNGDGTLTMEEWEETEAKAMEIAKTEDEE